MLPFEAILLLGKLASKVSIRINVVMSAKEGLSVILANLSPGMMIHIHTNTGMDTKS